MSNYEKEINRRRTFAIISHPDAGKTTLTEKLLLFGGAIHVAGAVKCASYKAFPAMKNGTLGTETCLFYPFCAAFQGVKCRILAA